METSPEKITWKNITVRLKDLKPWAGNPRESTKNDAENILTSFDEFGQVETVAVGPDFEVYDGHQRLSSLLLKFGPELEVDARQSSRALSEDERKRLVLYLHQKAKGRWSWDTLSSWDESLLIEGGFNDDAFKEMRRDLVNVEQLLLSANPPDFKEYDETAGDNVTVCECPTCGHKHAAKN